jgi:uncharacterized repeat protein (TIGR02543 family)
MINPGEAVSSGAGWRRTGAAIWRDSGTTETNVPVGSHTVEFKDVGGWTKPENVTVTVLEDQTATATGTYVINTYTVTFKDHDDTTLKIEEVPHGSAATPPADPTWEGYTFTGWDTDFSNVISDLTVTAQYQINTYTVTVSAQPEELGEVEGGGTYAADEDVTVTATPNAGYRFLYWSEDDQAMSVESDYTFTITNDRDLVAHFGKTFPFPDTGQTKCYDNIEEITCPQPGEVFYGQDAQYQPRLPRSYTKLGLGGMILADDALHVDEGGQWLMTKDNVTGLIWELKTEANKDDTYTWQDAQDVFIAGLNTDELGGYSDWRVPSVTELSSLVNASGPWIDPAWFPKNMSSYYWSSTTYAGNTIGAWRVYFDGGHVYYYSKSNSYYVRAVRAGKSGLRSFDNLVIHDDGTFSDPVTGLMWQLETALATYTWENALQYADDLNLAGYTDWRLPDKNELQSLVHYATFNPSVASILSENTQPYGYWSSTTNANRTDRAWLVNFYSGFVPNYDKSDGYYVRAVRSGQSDIGTFGSLAISISPAAAVADGAQWRRTGTSTWLNSGATESDVPTGSHTVEFKAVSGWTSPVSVSVTVSVDQTATATGTYVQAEQTSSIRVTIEPAEAQAAGAQWRRTGTNAWLNSGATESGVLVGAHVVECRPVSGWHTPEDIDVDVRLGEIAEAVCRYTEQTTFSVTYHGNGHTSGAVPVDADSPYGRGDQVTVLDKGDLERAGHTFTGWNTAADGSGTEYAQGATFAMQEEDVHLYAQWEAQTYSVTYHGNEQDVGEPPVDPGVYRYGGWVFVLGNSGNLSKERHTFEGWNDQPDGSGRDYPPGSRFQIQGAVDLYAKWRPIRLRTLHFPRIDGTGQWGTRIGLVNAGHEPAGLTLFVRHWDGALATQCPIELAAGSRVEYAAGEEDCLPAIQGYAYIQTYSDSITGFVRLGKADVYRMSLPLQAAYAQEEVVIPYVQSNEDQETFVGLTNPTDTVRNVEITFLATDGKRTLATLPLQAGEHSLFSVPDLLDLVVDEQDMELPENVISAMLSNVQGLVGFSMHEHATSHQLDGMLFTPMSDSMLIPHIYDHDEDEWTTTLVFANPSTTQPARLTFTGYSRHDSAPMDYSFTVPAGQREEGYPEHFGLPDEVAWATVAADIPVAGTVI